jgi:feruloyl-CoA synthase
LTQVSRKSKPPFASPAVSARRSRGSLLVRSQRELADYSRCVGEFLEYWAELLPGRSFLVERSTRGSWRHLTYAQTRLRVRRIAAWLIERRISPSRPVAILSENSIEHALLMLGCLHAGVPVAPISAGRSAAELKAWIQALDPSLVYVGEPERSELPKLVGSFDGLLVVGGDDPPDAAIPFAALASDRDSLVTRALSAVKPDTVAKILWSRDAAGEPRGVITTQRMLCSNQSAIAQLWPFIEELPVLIDGLPWSGAFGGNLGFNLALRNGGVLYIDRGRTAPGHFDETLANLRDVAPTVCLSDPDACTLLVGSLRRDEHFRQRFFRRLKLILCAGLLPEDVFEALQTLAREATDRELPVLSSWGLAETAPLAVAGHFLVDHAKVIGLPLPGTELKLVPHGEQFEARVRGPNVTPGYWKRLDLTASAFDAEGFFKTGEAVRFADRARPERGLIYDGRVSSFELDHCEVAG